MEAKVVTIPHNLTRSDLPFLAREILRVVFLGRQREIKGKEWMGKGQNRHQEPFDDYTECGESILFGKEVKARKKYNERLTEIRRGWKTRPRNVLRDQYKKAENNYLLAMQDSEALLDTLVLDAASHFSANAGFELFSGWNGWEGFKTEKNRRLEEKQDRFVFKYDNNGNGLLTGYYTQENPKVRTLTRLDMFPGAAAVRRGLLDRGPFLERIFVDPARRRRREYWDNSPTIQNANFRQAVELGCENDDDRKGLGAWWKKNKSLVTKHLPYEASITAGKGILGLVMAAVWGPAKLGEKVISAVDDGADNLWNYLFKGSGWSSLMSKERPSAVEKKKKADIDRRAESLFNRNK
jgi:hypothetical protein